MKSIIIAAALAAATIAAPAIAIGQTPPAAAKAGLSVDTTLISDIIKNEKAKAVLIKATPEIEPYFDQVGGMTLKALAPMSQGTIDDAKLKQIQAEFDKLK